VILYIDDVGNPQMNSLFLEIIEFRHNAVDVSVPLIKTAQKYVITVHELRKHPQVQYDVFVHLYRC
jgi:hypothetical protein